MRLPQFMAMYALLLLLSILEISHGFVATSSPSSTPPVIDRSTCFVADGDGCKTWRPKRKKRIASICCCIGIDGRIFPTRIDRWSRKCPSSSSVLMFSGNNFDGSEKNFPSVPEIDIDTNTLQYQAYELLTIKELKELLRQCGSKVSGNKKELVGRLMQVIMDREDNFDGSEENLPSEPEIGIDTNTLQYQAYEILTIKELKELLRQCGSKVSGNKKELVDRLMQEIVNSEDSTINMPSLDHYLERVRSPEELNTVEWHVLEPAITYFSSSNETNNELSEILDNDVEFPFLSGLLFVNKPSGMSTLPTKQQLTQMTNDGESSDPVHPIYPCLSDSVKEWLYSHPVGKKRLERARKDEEKWWDFILQSHHHLEKPHSKENPQTPQHKEWKKKKKQIKRQQSKNKSFEPRPVHRLDIDTSGIVCIAISPYALRAASMLFERKSRLSFEGSSFAGGGGIVQKQYVALVEGTLGSSDSNVEDEVTTNQILKAGTISYSVGKVWVQGDGEAIDGHHEWACDILNNGTLAFRRPGEEPLGFVPGSLREAITSYNAVDWSTAGNGDRNNNATRVELTPHTGRGHQLRLHMSSIGHPILNDDMHGRDRGGDLFEQNYRKIPTVELINKGALCLHASKLSMDGWCLGLEKRDDTSFRKCRIMVESAPQF